MAIASLILGVVSFLLIFFCIGWVTALMAIVFGAIGLTAIKSGQGRITGKGMAITGILTAILSVVIYVGFLVFIFKNAPEKSAAEKAAAAEFQKAENKLAGKAGGYGDTDLEKQIAETFNESFKMLHGMTIDTGDATDSQLRKIKSGFVSVCDITDKGVVIIAKVPEYNSHADDAKDTVADNAWMSANMALAEHSDEIPNGSLLVVGLKGNLLYGAVMKGAVGADNPNNTNTDEGVIERLYLVEESEEASGGVLKKEEAPETEAEE